MKCKRSSLLYSLNTLKIKIIGLLQSRIEIIFANELHLYFSLKSSSASIRQLNLFVINVSLKLPFSKNRRGASPPLSFQLWANIEKKHFVHSSIHFPRCLGDIWSRCLGSVSAPFAWGSKKIEKYEASKLCSRKLHFYSHSNPSRSVAAESCDEWWEEENKKSNKLTISSSSC